MKKISEITAKGTSVHVMCAEEENYICLAKD